MSEKRRRIASIASRYTPFELAEIAERAHAVGMTIGQYQRAAALDTASLPLPRVRRRRSPEMAMLDQILGQIGKIGSNVNQIARVLNSGNAAPAELQHALAAVAEMRRHVRAAMGAVDDH